MWVCACACNRGNPPDKASQTSTYQLMNNILGNYGESDEEDQGLAQEPPKKVLRSSPSSSSRLSPEHNPRSVFKEDEGQLVFESGEHAIYLSNQPCVIVAKHMDDYPNLYYTIQLKDDNNREKQTTAQTLSKCDDRILGGGSTVSPAPPSPVPPSPMQSSSSLRSSSIFIGIK